MKITLKYERKNFFGNREYTEDTTVADSTDNALKACQKAFKHVLSGHSSALEVGGYDGEKGVIIWQEYKDIENDIFTVRMYEAVNSWQETKMSKQAVQKMLRKISQID